MPDWQEGTHQPLQDPWHQFTARARHLEFPRESPKKGKNPNWVVAIAEC